MHLSLPALLFSLASSYFVAGQAQESLQHTRALSLYIPYVDDELRMRYWDYGGDTIVHTNSHIRLTSDYPDRSGFLWSKQFLPEEAWQVEFEFKVHGHGTHLFGDGFAFWAATVRNTPGNVFGSRDYFTGLGIFFDTYKNGNRDKYFPYIYAALGDGATLFDHDNDGLKNEIAGCEADFRATDRSTKARVTYYKGSSLKLELQYTPDGEWVKCFNTPGVKLPGRIFLGFSATTGEVSENHDIIYVTTSEITSPAPSAQISSQSFTGGPLQGETSFGFMLKLVLFSAVCGIAYMGYRMFQQQTNKRF